jgi:hypothetical protein
MKKQGTLELQQTLSLWQIKRKISWCVATDCTGHYSNIHLCENNLQVPEVDMGSTIGSYAGLMLLMVRILLSEFSRQPIR